MIYVWSLWQLPFFIRSYRWKWKRRPLRPRTRFSRFTIKFLLVVKTCSRLLIGFSCAKGVPLTSRRQYGVILTYFLPMWLYNRHLLVGLEKSGMGSKEVSIFNENKHGSAISSIHKFLLLILWYIEAENRKLRTCTIFRLPMFLTSISLPIWQGNDATTLSPFFLDELHPSCPKTKW